MTMVGRRRGSILAFISASGRSFGTAKPVQIVVVGTKGRDPTSMVVSQVRYLVSTMHGEESIIVD